MVNLQAQYRKLEPDLLAAVHDVMEKSQFILGENVRALETEIAGLCGAKYGISVASGTDAITISLAAAGIGPDDEVITTPFTFVATTESIVLIGAKPVYVDIDPITFNIDPSAIEAAVTPKTKAILPVHLYGQCAGMDEILDIAKRRSLKVVCDGAQAIGSTYRNRSIGELGDAATLSFFPTKNLGAFGDGGMILTNDDAIANRAQSLRFHGMSRSYTYEDVGYCSRLDEIQAAVLRVKLAYLKDWNERRRAHAAIYNQALHGGAIVSPVEERENYHIYHQYTVRSSEREKAQAILKEAGVGSAIYYPAPIHVQNAYRFLGYKDGDFPEAEKASQEVFSVPVHPELTDEEVETVAKALSSAAKELSS